MKFIGFGKVKILDFLFPRTCSGCGRRGKYFCELCVNKIELARPQIYPASRPFVALISLFAYQDIIRQAILKLKYSFVSDLADELIDLSFRLNEKHFSSFDWAKYILVPVPLHWRRKNWRGFNQAELLGEKLAKKLKIKFIPDLLIRKRFTKPQAKLKQKERHVNIRGAFAINYKQSLFLVNARNKNYILFDDVWTTGATMKECGRVLKKAGAKKILGLTLAR